MSATSGGGGSVSEGSDAGESSQSTMSVSDSPSTSFQTNLVAENVTKITLSEENGAGGYAADMTGSKINLTLDERQQKDGIVNVAFDYEEGGNRCSSGGGGGGGGSGSGEFRSMNGSEKKDKVPEAVNLELVNMVPYSNGNGTSYGIPVNGIPGIPMKKDSEQVDMSTPYDEYFVPVNEHKKYMRGEKLYVTKDKRRPTSWRRCLSWIVACTVISVVLIVAILAGTGVILSQEPDLVKDASVGRNFAGSNLKPTVTDKSFTPTAEKLMYVPRSIESEFVIDNLDFDPALRDLNSSAYQQFTSNMENQLTMLLFDKETLETGASDIGVRVVNVSRNPFKVNYRIGWNYKQGVNNPPEPIKMEDVKRRLVESLARNHGYIDKYHIDREAIKVNHVINACQMENGGCSHICYYNYLTQLFTCTCPTHLVLDRNGKNCIAWSGSSEDDAVPIPSHAAYPGMPYESTSNPAQEFDYSSNLQHGVHQGVPYHQESSSEHSTEYEYKSDIINQQYRDHETAAEPIPEPTAKPDLNQENKSSVIPESIPEPNVKENHHEELDRAMHTDGVNSQYEHGQTNIHLSNKNSGSEVVPEPTAEPTSEDKYHDQAHSVHESEEHAPEPALESTASKDNHPAVHSAYDPKDGEPAAEPTPEPAPEPAPEPNPGSDDHGHAVHSAYDPKDGEPAAEPTPEPAPEPAPEPSTGSDDHGHVVHSAYDPKDGEPTPEPAAEPAPEPNPGSDDHGHAVHSAYDPKDSEPAAEPTPEPAPEPAPEPSPGSDDHGHVVHSAYDPKDGEPAAEPTPEPAAEPAPEPNPGSDDHGHAVHSVYESKHREPAAEPTHEPTAESDAKHRVHAVHSMNEFKDQEPSVELTPEPAPEPTSESSLGSDNYDHVHSVYDSKNHEPAAESIPEPVPEPAPEPTPGSDDHDHIVHSVHESKNHEPAVEPTAEPASEPTTESDSKHSVHAVHSINEFKDQEPVVEPTPGPGQQDQEDKEIDAHSSKNKEPVAEPTLKPSPDDQNKEYDAQFMHEIKDLPEATTVYTPLNGNQAAEKNPKDAPQPIPEPSADNDHQTHSSNFESSEPLGTTTRLMPTQVHMNSGPNSSLNDSREQPVQHQEQMQVTNFKNEPDKENKLGHHVPYLQDVLIRTSSSDMEQKNSTSHGRNVLQDVELTESGKPVIEEVLIDRSLKKGQDESETSTPAMTFRSQVDTESDRSNPTIIENSPDHKSIFTDSPNNNSTKESVFMIRPSSQSSETKTMPTETDESASTGLTNAERSTVQQSAPNEKDMSKIYLEHTETRKDNRESTVTSNNENPTHKFNAESNSFSADGTPMNSASGTDQQHRSGIGPQDGMRYSTLQPDIQHEYHTIPVAIEVSGFSETDRNNDGNPKQDSNAESDEHQTSEKINLGHAEGSTISGINSNDDVMLSHSGLDQTKVREITTEPHIATTMLFSVLPPDAIDGKINLQLTDQKEKEAIPRETVFQNGTVNIHSHPESNETTKSPEELSNNIKDELLDNEEFNTLLDKERNKEGGPNDGKELISKYPSKSQKGDKKKLKDYIKGEKLDSDKKTEVTARPAVTPEDFILQKHVNGNENTFDLDYSLQNEHTTKHDGEVTVIDPQGFDGVPGVSFKPHGINNHDLRVLQTVAPDSSSETGQTYELEIHKPDSKVKLLDNREGDKQDKDYAKFDKDYKYEKQKVSKKKDLKKKGGSGKDGKNVELDEGRKYFTETSKENPETSHEIVKEVPEVMSPFEKITVQPDIGIRLASGPAGETTAMPEYKGKVETTFQPGHINTLEKRTEIAEDVTEYMEPSKSIREETGSTEFGKSDVRLQDDDQHSTPLDQRYHQMIDEVSVKTTSSVSSGIVHDGQLPASINSTDSRTKHLIMNSSSPFTVIDNSGLTLGSSDVTPGTVFDGMSIDIVSQGSQGQRSGFQINGTVVDGAGYSISSMVPKIMVNEGTTPELHVANTTTANPTIIIHGQSGSLQDGHILRFVNSTFHNLGNATVTSVLNGTLGHSDGQAFTFTNYTTTFPNGSVVQPTIIVRGQSGTLQGGHEIRFGNATFITSLPNGHPVIKNSTVYRIENGSLPGTVFDGHFNPQNGHYHMFSNSSGTYVFSNATAQPTFIIKGQSGDFGNSRAYIMPNVSGSIFSRDFTGPSVIFRNSTVFAVGNTPGMDMPTVSIKEVTAQPQDVTSNETINYTRQMSPNFFSTGTAYKVNNYFGYISKCAAGQFQCVNGTSKRGSACISLSSKCDSINDCSDGSDELGCIENGCPGNFQCSDGSCLKRNLVCNGILDCSDGSDEKQCGSWKCEFDEFQCPSGRCIPVVWQCDGKPDCDNHTDEYNCQTSCGNDEYLCPEGWCVPLTYRCNGVKECSMGEDEQLCDCSHEEFKCQTGGCVSVKQICDGLDDCPDRSDEWDCVKLERGSNLLKIRTASGDFEPVCADDWTSRNSDEVCASLGYYSSVPMENENSSSITTETSFFALKNGSTENFNKKVLVNLKKSEGNCSSGKLVAVSCQEFSCGSRSMTDSSSVEARLVGGMSATAGQWPSVSLLYNIRNFHSCTANVLTPRWVLASYNCLKMGNKNLNEQDWKFFGGSTVFEAERENAETRKIMSIIPHPQVKFNQFLFSNDLALVELDQSLQFTSNLGAVCLPEQEMQPRQICVTAGWGMNTPEDKSIRQQLQYLPVPTMNLTECNSTEHYSGFITDDKICAGYNSAQKSLCYNEEGAPLMCVNDRGEWELQGVLSYHSNCGRGSHPSIFSSITPVTDWIKKTIGNTFERKAVAITKR